MSVLKHGEGAESDVIRSPDIVVVAVGLRFLYTDIGDGQMNGVISFDVNFIHWIVNVDFVVVRVRVEHIFQNSIVHVGLV